MNQLLTPTPTPTDLLATAWPIVLSAASSAATAVRKRRGRTVDPMDVASECATILLAGDDFSPIAIGRAAATAADRCDRFDTAAIPTGDATAVVGEDGPTAEAWDKSMATADREATANVLPKHYAMADTVHSVDVYGVSQASRDGMRAAEDVLIHSLTERYRAAAMLAPFSPTRAAEGRAWSYFLTADLMPTGWLHAVDLAAVDADTEDGPPLVGHWSEPTEVPDTRTFPAFDRGGPMPRASFTYTYERGGVAHTVAVDRLRFQSAWSLARQYPRTIEGWAWCKTFVTQPATIGAPDLLDRLAAAYYPLTLTRQVTKDDDGNRVPVGSVIGYRKLRGILPRGTDGATAKAFARALAQYSETVAERIDGATRTDPCAHVRWDAGECDCPTRVGGMFNDAADAQRRSYRLSLMLRRDARVAPFGPYRWTRTAADAPILSDVGSTDDTYGWYVRHGYSAGCTVAQRQARASLMLRADTASGKWARVMDALAASTSRFTLVLTNAGTSVDLCVPHDGGGATYADADLLTLAQPAYLSRNGATRFAVWVSYRDDGSLSTDTVPPRWYGRVPAYGLDVYDAASERCNLAIAETHVRRIGRRVIDALVGTTAAYRYRLARMTG